MTFEIVKANIVNIAADAIVLPANEALREGSGTSSAIFEAAGREQLTQACKDLGHCDMGSAVPTLAYDLDAKYIVHAVVPKWKDGNSNEYDLLSSAYIAALNIADVLECESIAFPLLASGNNGFNKKLAVRIAEESISSFEGKNLKKVLLIVYGNTMEVFMKGLGYNVTIIPEQFDAGNKNGNQPIDNLKAEHRAIQKQLLTDGKEAALTLLENQIAMAIDWIKKPENGKIILEAGKLVFKLVSKH